MKQLCFKHCEESAYALMRFDADGSVSPCGTSELIMQEESLGPTTSGMTSMLAPKGLVLQLYVASL
eukprot:6456906-Amphidinium_carterae.1